MGLLEQIYSVFGLGYTIALAVLKHKDFSGADIAFIAATAAFVSLSIGKFLNEVRVIPWGYKWRYTGKSFLRGLLGPLMWLLYYPVLFCHSKCLSKCVSKRLSKCVSKCIKRALTFSNEAYDGVERTRQVQIFELVKIEPGARYNSATHDLLRYEGGKWGYDRRVGELWVRVRFENLDFSSTDQRLKLKTSGDGTTSLVRAPALQTTLQDNDSDSVKVSFPRSCLGLECICGDLEWGSIPADPETPTRNLPPERGKNPVDPGSSEITATPADPETPTRNLPPERGKSPVDPGTSGTSGTPADPETPTRNSLLERGKNPVDPESSGTSETPANYEVTITWRRGIWRIKKRECCRCNCLRRKKENKKHGKKQQPEPCFVWNLKRKEDRTWNLFQIHQYILCLDAWGNHPKQGIWRLSNKLFRYCYRHDELTDAIEEKKRLRQRQNNGTWYTVV